MLTTINHFFTLLGPSVVVPVIILIVARALRVPLATAIRSALAVGVGLTGFSWLISAFTPLVTKVVRQLVATTGIHLPVVDLGWQAGSLAAFSAPVGIAFFVFALLLELVLFALGVTRIFMPANLWNNFGFMIWAVLAMTVTHNALVAFGLATFLLLVTLLLAEVQAPAWAAWYRVPTATVAAAHNLEQSLPLLLLDPLYNRLGLNRSRLTTAHFRHRFGLLGEPTSLGALLGLGLGILANLTRLNRLAAWSQIGHFAIQLAAIMTLFPLVTKVFAAAFTPLAAAIQHRQPSTKRGGQWFLAIDDGVGFGDPATLTAGMVLLPLLVGAAFLLPGNRTLPVVDLIALPFMLESVVALTRGNLVKVVLTGLIWGSLGLYAASWLAPVYTSAVTTYGTTLPTGVVLATSFNLMAHPLTALIFAAFVSQNPLWIGLCLLLYLSSLLFFRTHRTAVWATLEKRAALNGPLPADPD